MVDIPAGEFYANVDAPAGETRDDLRTLSAFRIDRTEVTEAAFAVYDELEPLTGDAATPSFAGPPRREPAVWINYTTALSYCEYMGKTLPSVDQWQKAFRGGLTLPSGPNPDPRRETTWLHTASDRPANLEGALATVGSFPEDTSPYGLKDMAGNVSEWTRSLETRSSPHVVGLRTVLGASWDTPKDRTSHLLISWRNVRTDRYLGLGIGVRCISQP